MKSRFMYTLAIMATLALALGVVPVSAQTIVYSSAYNVMNLEGAQATVLIQYYDQVTGDLAASGTINIPANGQKTVFPFITDGISGPATFNGSAVLSSDRQIAAILNTETTPTSVQYGASTNGFSAGATDISLPLIGCGNSGFSSWFNVQNAGTGNADITVSYIAGLAGNNGFTDPNIIIKPGAAKTFNQAEAAPPAPRTARSWVPAPPRSLLARLRSTATMASRLSPASCGSARAATSGWADTMGSPAVRRPLPSR